MINIPIKTKERIISGIKKFQPILAKAKDRDINESDTVSIIADILSDVFGYDKYTEITSEYLIKKTFCDVAIKYNGKLRLLIEVKAIGLDLKDEHVRQAVNYGSNEGVDWIILTNGIAWKVFKIKFSKPIEKELIYEFNYLTINYKKQIDLELIYYLCKEAISKSSKNTSLDDYCIQKEILSKFSIGQILLSDSILDSIRKIIKKMAPESKITDEEIKQVLHDDIIKREILEGEKAIEAQKKIAKLDRPVKTVKAEKIEKIEKAVDVE